MEQFLHVSVPSLYYLLRASTSMYTYIYIERERPISEL